MQESEQERLDRIATLVQAGIDVAPEEVSWLLTVIERLQEDRPAFDDDTADERRVGGVGR